MTSNNSICSYDVKNNLRSMIGYKYDSDHDFYEQLKKAIYYDGETYIGVCKRLIELIGSGCCHGKVDVNAERDEAAGWVEEHGGIVELDKRLMPPGVEWPRFEDGKQITWNDAPEDITAVCLALDGSCYALHYDMPDDERMCIYEVSERVKRPVTVVLGADGLPIKVGETVWYVGEPLVRGTVEAVGEGEVMLAGDGVYAPLDLTHTQPDTQERIDDDATMYPHEYCKKHGIQAGTPDNALFALSDFVEPMALDLLRRQRELDARTMGGE